MIIPTNQTADHDVFAALADPTRRAILDRLRDEGALSIKEISAPLTVSRQAATKHLDVLSKCGLVSTQRKGRERQHQLMAPALEPVADWLRPYEKAWDRRLERLTEYLDLAQDHNQPKGTS